METFGSHVSSVETFLSPYHSKPPDLVRKKARRGNGALMLDVETFLLAMPRTEKGPTWKRLPYFFQGTSKNARNGSTWKRFSRPVRRGNVFGSHSLKTSAFGPPKLVRDKDPDVETFAKRFHVEPVDPKSWRRGNVFQNVSTSSGKARRGNVFRIGAEECPTWKRFGPKGARVPRMVSVEGGVPRPAAGLRRRLPNDPVCVLIKDPQRGSGI